MASSKELASFRQWVHSLSTEDLVCAMEFEVLEDELGLLQEMVKLQAPPPTPIHPGIAKEASLLGVTNGQNQEAYAHKIRFGKPRLFQLIEMGSTLTETTSRRRHASSSRRRFHVIARKFVTSSGDVLSLGCTQEQRDCDEALLKGTRIHTAMNKKRGQCVFLRDIGTTDVLRLLHVTSRGRFLSRHPSSSRCMSFCAPWMNADIEWFSLPLYLASRFEVALWASYRQQRESVKSSSWSTSIQNAMKKLSDNSFQKALLTAAIKTLHSDILPYDTALVRHGVMWNLLDSRWAQTTTEHPDQFLAHLGSVSIVDFGSSKHTLQKNLWFHLQETISIENEKDILNSLDDEDHTVRVSISTKRKRGKKKRLRKEPSFATPPDENDSTSYEVTARKPESELQFPTISPESMKEAKEYTRKIILAGTIVDDMLEAVFDQVGLNRAPKESRAKTDSTEKRAALVEEASLKEEDTLPPLTQNPRPSPPQSPVANGGSTPFRPTISVPRIPPAHQSYQYQENSLECEVFVVPWIFDDNVDGWEKLRRYPNREKSLLADLFLSQRKDGETGVHVASSTAASIASSSDKGSESGEDNSNDSDATPETDEEDVIAPVLEEAVFEAVAASFNDADESEPLEKLMSVQTIADVESSDQVTHHDVAQDTTQGEAEPETKLTMDDSRSPSPPAPKTPPPQLSPILVSLADLKTIRTRATSENVESPKARFFSAATLGSLPNSPLPPSYATLAPSWSRDDLRMASFADDHRLTQRKRGRLLLKKSDSLGSYRNVAVRSLSKAKSTTSEERKSSFAEAVKAKSRASSRSGLAVQDLGFNPSRNDSDNCAQSETAFESHSYELPLNDRPKHGCRADTEVTISTKGDSSPRRDTSSQDIDSLREERNAFSDMCLTLGAEVAKLKNMLAAHGGVSFHVVHPAIGPLPFGQEFVPSFLNGVPKATTVGAMSDAGIHETAISEDDTDGAAQDTSGRPRLIHLHRMSSGATTAASDLSWEQNLAGQANAGTGSFRSLSRDVIGSISGHGLHSRLTEDILKFLSTKRVTLRLQDSKKTAAIQRLTRLVTAMWPRAQVKIYGSHATGLCLPSSDLDFVICLPAVHKNAPAVTPGVLEGRNSINESSQKSLARNLKGESWIDPRSIRIIQAIVPIIKVSTKDTRARMLQLDISFDGPEHHGLAANRMIADVLQEFPMIQPLVLVLKQFLKDRGLLTSFTGGLSSYCLFLMVTRYLQEHASSWGDCGSLLMGFLDFYGNAFDPRATGISVGRSQYFARPNFSQPQQVWTAYPQQVASPAASVGSRSELIRRNSFNDNATVDGPRGSPHGSRPPRFQHSSHHRFSHHYKHPMEQDTAENSGTPYTFDPLFVEDPLAVGNNVGRNAFRIYQVQRAFSDAHRALVASLEWDIHSSHDPNDGGEYPLLNCLLHSEDVFYELDDTRQ